MTVAACQSKQTPNETAQAEPALAAETYILVPGAFADASAWGAVVPILEAKGQKAIPINLPGHGTDTTSLQFINMQTYVDYVVNIINQQPDSVVMVGHSMAGIIVSGVAEKIPSKIKRLIYVGAYLPRNNESLLKLSQMDTASLVGKNLQFAPDYSTTTIKKEALIEAICADCPADLQKIILDSQKPEPLHPFSDSLTLTAANFGSVPKFYIQTSEDHAVTNRLQQQMIANNGQIRKTATIATGHLPFLSQPQQFVDILLKMK